MEYYARNEEALKAEKDTLEKQASLLGNTAPMLYLQNGSTMVRVLPPYSDAGVFFRQIWKHVIKVGGKYESFACPAAMENLECPICDKGQELVNTKDEIKMKFANDNLRPRTQYIYNVLCYSGPPDRRGKALEFGKVYVLEAGVTVHRQIITLDQDLTTGWGDITNPESGVNLIIKRVGAGLDTKYSVAPHGGGRTNLVHDCQARGIDPNSELKLINLDEVYNLLPKEKLNEFATAIIVGASFQVNATSPRPVLPTVSPAAAVNPTPVPATPVPVVAPAPQTLPQSTVMPMMPPQQTTVQVTPPVETVTVASPGVPEQSTTDVPQPPVVPAPPTK